MPNDPHTERVLRWASAVLVGFVVVGSSLVVASLVIAPDDGDDPGSAALASSPARAPSASPTTSAAPSDAPSTSPSTSPAGDVMTKAGMTGFLEDYLATAARDPARSWTMLTPSFQRASGGFAAYDAFWGPVTRATASGVFADPEAARITYSVTYVGGRGGGDSTRLTLVLDDGRYRIDGEG